MLTSSMSICHYNQSTLLDIDEADLELPHHGTQGHCMEHRGTAWNTGVLNYLAIAPLTPFQLMA